MSVPYAMLRLEEFLHISAQNVQPEMYKDLMSMPSLKYVDVGYGSRKKNEEFNALVLRSGKQTGTTGILPSDENVQTVGQCLICGVLVHVTAAFRDGFQVYDYAVIRPVGRKSFPFCKRKDSAAPLATGFEAK